MRNIHFYCKISQRHRSFLHMVEPLLSSGYSITVHPLPGTALELDKLNVSGIAGANINSYTSLAKNLGVPDDLLSQIKWTDQCKPKSIRMSVDRQSHDGAKTHVNVPCQGIYAYRGKKRYLCGDFLAESVRDNQSKFPERSDQLLILHSGGGRGIVSPLYVSEIFKKNGIDLQIITDNNIGLLRTVIDNLPEGINKIVIKTHPVCTLNCDAETMFREVLPILDDNRVSVESENLIKLLCSSKYVISFGSSLVCSLVGGGKFWCALKGIGKYNKTGKLSKFRRDAIARADDWDSWPQVIASSEIGHLFDYYKDLCSKKKKYTRYGIDVQKRNSLPAVSLVMSLLESVK